MTAYSPLFLVTRSLEFAPRGLGWSFNAEKPRRKMADIRGSWSRNLHSEMLVP